METLGGLNRLSLSLLGSARGRARTIQAQNPSWSVNDLSEKVDSGLYLKSGNSTKKNSVMNQGMNQFLDSDESEIDNVRNERDGIGSVKYGINDRAIENLFHIVQDDLQPRHNIRRWNLQFSGDGRGFSLNEFYSRVIIFTKAEDDDESVFFFDFWFKAKVV